MTVASELIEEPVSGSRAFADEDDASLLSRAAILLCLGGQVRELIRPNVDEQFPGVIPRWEPDDGSEFEDLKVLAVPELKPGLSRPGLRAEIQDKYGIQDGDSSAPERLHDLADQLEKSSNPYDALALFECGAQHPDPLTRVASVIAYRNWTIAPLGFVPILAEEVENEDPLIATLARDELARVAPEHPALEGLIQDVARTAGARSHTSLLVHGTWARFEKWWQPGGGFHDYLLANHVPDLYDQVNRYEWSGAWSDHARGMTAVELGGWLAARGIGRLDKLLGHSHGANVSMAATHGSAQAEQLVLLSCPVHANKYLPDFSHVVDVVSFQVHMDLVVLADGGNLKFRHPRIRDVTIPVWFKHDASHDEGVWDRYSLDSHL